MIFRNLPIKHKLIFIIQLVSFCAVGLVFAFVIANDIKTFKSNLRESTTINAKLIGEYCITPLAFDDKAGAQEILKKLQTISYILNGNVYDDSGRLFAAYGRTENIIIPPALPDSSSEFKEGYLHVSLPIMYKNQKYGTIYLRASTRPLKERINRYILMMLALMVGIMLLSYFLAYKLQNIFSKPILNLAETAREISNEGDYSIRVEKKGADEIGTLYDEFNEMLEQITIREEALKRERDNFINILETMQDGVYIVDQQYNIQYVNPALENEFGFYKKGQKCYEYLLNSQNVCEFCKNKDVLLGKTVRWEFYAPKTGKTYDLIDTPLRNPDGSISMLEIFRDITELKDTQKALQRARDELEKRVVERTAELEHTYKQLLHAEKLSAVGRLSASIAHEFNNPLYGVMNVLEGLSRRSSFDKEDEKLVDLAVRECNRMKNLIRDLQDFNRPTSGVMASMNIHKAIDDMLLLCKKKMKEKKIILKKDYVKDMPIIKVVEDQIRQVILNLLYNATDSCGEEGVIKITTEVFNKTIKIHIQDSGKGIAQEDIGHIFEPFFTTKEAVKGIGLGLSVSYGIVNRHGGSIEVKSKKGKGAIFSIILPIEGALHEKQVNFIG